MAKKVKKRNKHRPRVKYAEANRVRSLLLSEKVQTLSKRDVQTLIQILDDVYPAQQRRPRLVWQPILIGIGIGIILIIGMALTV
jgi:hypothetical protein